MRRRYSKIIFFHQWLGRALVGVALLLAPRATIADTIQIVWGSTDQLPAGMNGSYDIPSGVDTFFPLTSPDGYIVFRTSLRAPDGQSKLGVFRLGPTFVDSNTDPTRGVTPILDQLRPIPGFPADARIQFYTSTYFGFGLPPYQIIRGGNVVVEAAVTSTPETPPPVLWCGNSATVARLAPRPNSPYYQFQRIGHPTAGSDCGVLRMFQEPATTPSTTMPIRLVKELASGTMQVYSDTSFPGLNTGEYISVDLESSYQEDRYLLSARIFSNPPTGSADTALWVRDPSGLRMLVRENNPAPGVSGRVMGMVSSFQISPTGGVVFSGPTKGSPTDSYENYRDTLWTNFSGALAPAIRADEPINLAGQIPSSYVFSRVPWRENVALKDNNTAYVTALLVDTASQSPGPDISTLWKISNSGRQLLLRSGVALAGDSSGFVFHSFPDQPKLSVSPAGKIALQVQLINPSTGETRQALITNGSGQFKVVAYEGQVIPNTDGATLNKLGYFNRNFAEVRQWRYQINDRGQIVFPASVAAAPTTTIPNPEARSGTILRVDSNGNLRKLLRDYERVPYQGGLTTLLGAVSTSFMQSLTDNGEVGVLGIELVGVSAVIAKVAIVDEGLACRADLDGDRIAGIGDLFIFLNRWFAGNGDFNGDGINSVQDVFDFLNAWFAGC